MPPGHRSDTTSTPQLIHYPLPLHSFYLSSKNTITMATESTFPVLRSRLDLRAKHLQQNKADWDDILNRFEDALKRVSAQGNEVSLNRHQSRGQLLRG